MNLNRLNLLALILIQLLLIIPASSQSIFDLYFQGRLADIQGKAIGNEQFDLAVKIIKKTNYKILYEINTSSSSDENGWFSFAIPNMSHFLLEEGEPTHSVEIKMEILPNESTKWMQEGEDFMVTYTLQPYRDSADNQLMMTRMEGSKLVKHSEDHLIAFKDRDPFAYLLGGFLIIDQAPSRDSSLLDLQQWLTPESGEEDGGVSRGVKGGFPSGGYYKKKGP